jgi:hypothetical protein
MTPSTRTRNKTHNGDLVSQEEKHEVVLVLLVLLGRAARADTQAGIYSSNTCAVADLDRYHTEDTP